ncbi:unnamed protein product [Spirodela intermedia]|uniref:Uncharacterized protein n=1 Tax=Spirodela intermedia TaxID=51605 RepID=A0A7I8IFW6_SPIIN|nr:unnamed protein product [Spirodela intermedia]CAA6656609.1 unnamed protein product [Spirodela intermedia]
MGGRRRGILCSGSASSPSAAAALILCCCVAVPLLVSVAEAEDPYRFFTWNVTYGDIWPLGVKQQGILINGMFPGPPIEAVTNDNLIINVHNSLAEPFLLSCFVIGRFSHVALRIGLGFFQERDSAEEELMAGRGAGTNCPIPPGRNFTYILQVKDQIGSYFYFPSLAFHKAAGGLEGAVDNGQDLPFPDGLVINGRGLGGTSFTVDQGKTYRFRISNVGLTQSFNIRFEGHTMKLVEVEGSHTLQSSYSNLDVHVGQSYSVLLTADQLPRDYHIVVSSRFTSPSSPPPPSSATPTAGPPDPPAHPWWNLTASGPRPNPQGSYHYGLITPGRTIRLANSAPVINGKQRYAVNGVSFVPADTPLKVADFYNIPGVFTPGSIPDSPSGGGGYLKTSVMASNFRDFIEIIFENSEDTLQSWHIDGYSFFVVGMDGGQWSPASRAGYNLRDAVARSTVQVYPRSWSAIYVALDNVGMWNVRSENWARQYLGQQFYLRVYSPVNSWRDEYPIPKNALLCGRAAGRRTRPSKSHRHRAAAEGGARSVTKG